MQSSAETTAAGTSGPLVQSHAPDLQQRDNLCGPFQAARVLNGFGIEVWDGEQVDQDLVALHAGSVLPEVEIGPQVPPGASNLRDYRFELPRAEAARSGTPLPSLVAAIDKLSGGRLACVPLSGEWTATAVEELVAAADEAGVRLIANVRTGHFWGSHPPLEALLAVLDGEEFPQPPAADWDAGHFVELMRVLRGRRGALVLVGDSYPTLGWGGVHLQPPAAVAAALMRGDGRGGGVLGVGLPDAAAEFEAAAGRVGIHVKMWDNRS